MSKGPKLWRLHDCVLTVILTAFLMFGCGSTSQPERPTQIASVAEPLPENKAVAQVSETTIAAEQNAVAKAEAEAEAELDEKNSIFFLQGSSTIIQREKHKLRQVASFLKSNKQMCVTLIGHAYDNGSRSFNLAVADARVESVVSALKKAGVKRHQIKKNVVGDEKASNTCRSEECRSKMRRVELVITNAP